MREAGLGSGDTAEVVHTPLPREGPPRGCHGVGVGEDVWLVITSLSKGLCCVEPGAAHLRGVWWGAGEARLGPGLLAVSRGHFPNTPFPWAGDRTQGWLLGAS